MSPLTAETVRHLRVSAAGMIVMIAVGGALVAASGRFLADEQRSLKTAQARLADIQGRLARAKQEEQEIREKIARFHDLQARGILGEEERLNWVDQIRRIKAERKLYEIEYEISPQRVFTLPAFPGGGSGFEFYTSPMQLRMDLLHEEDLRNFLSDFSAVHAHVRVSKCAIERLSRAGGGTGPAAQLRASCILDLITARERKGIPQ
ncbi:MAG: hypothetical protein AB1768_00820 [Pseudomonadota bacterium]|jgi:hypothetical protein